MSAKKAAISDEALLCAFSELLKGQAVDLGGGVWKKRMNLNRHRAIALARGRMYCVFQFLFAKSAQENISASELGAFKALAKAYEGLTREQIQHLLELREWVEIKHE